MKQFNLRTNCFPNTSSTRSKHIHPHTADDHSYAGDTKTAKWINTRHSIEVVTFIAEKPIATI